MRDAVLGHHADQPNRGHIVGGERLTEGGTQEAVGLMFLDHDTAFQRFGDCGMKVSAGVTFREEWRIAG